MFNFTIPHIRTFIPAKMEIKPRLAFYRSVNQQFCSWLQYVSRHMQPSLVPFSDSYPWCFVSPAYAISQRHFMVGAFLPAWQTTESQPAALYVLIKKESTIRLLQHIQNETLPFFMMRILALLAERGEQEKYKKELYRWLQRLQCMLPAIRCSRQFMYANGARWKIDSLRVQHCGFDFRYKDEDGVDVMPWIDWPNCTLSSNEIWLWRQSRNGKILESQKLDRLIMNQSSKDIVHS